MTVPGYQSLFLPLLKLCGDGKEHSVSSAAEALANQMNLSSEDRQQLLPSGRQKVLFNRVSWAKIYMAKALLLESHRRGAFRITDRGKKVLAGSPSKIDNTFLNQYPEFVKFRKDSRSSAGKTNGDEVVPASMVAESHTTTPTEALDYAYQQIRGELVSDLMQKFRGRTPEFFERLVLDVLLAMGYGNNKIDAAEKLGRSGDEGVDGVIKEDKLGLDVIYIQAKRWRENNVVGRPEVQKFVGALQGKRAKKGIFITASSFTEEASEYAASIDTKVVLIDGARLANLMIDFNIGVSLIDSYHLKRLDSDYFTEE